MSEKNQTSEKSQRAIIEKLNEATIELRESSIEMCRNRVTCNKCKMAMDETFLPDCIISKLFAIMNKLKNGGI